MSDPNFIPHPEAEFFDAVTIETVERWKDSELSGDEWRFSHTAILWHRGHIMGEVGGLTVKDAMMRALVALGDPGGGMFRESDDAEGHGMYDMLKTHCCQPGCTNPWTVLLRPVNRYYECNEVAMGSYHDDDVRAFCDEHKRRGDADCEDNDANYTDVTSSYPPNPLVVDVLDPEDPGDTMPEPVDPALVEPVGEAVSRALTEAFGKGDRQ